MSRKRIHKQLVCYVTDRGMVTVSKIPESKKLHAKVFGVWKPINESDLPMYEGFEVEYL